MTKTFLAAAFLSGLITLPALAALKTGESAPDFSAPAALAGKEFEFSLKGALENGPGSRLLLSFSVHGRL